MSPRKPASQELTKEMILKEARIQFVIKGYNQVSVRNIAKKLGCSHGSIYYHFKNKAELFYAIVEEDFSVLNKLVDETIHGDEDDEKKLIILFIRFIEFGLNHQNQYELMFMVRNDEVDSLSQEAAHLSYQKFARAVQLLANNQLAIKDIWSAFISLHGFVSHHWGYVDSFEEARDGAIAHVNFILIALFPTDDTLDDL
ncbi:TetR/AcrR family transcriptional regulator [Bacillus sp. FJAT-45350]|uniref:TetR/AcrR family transcriptional regulator n=1 Tax=Bacillus sp. FJAT-45350 TaxID=2011014 RepID=UPI000BB7949C|nr:TetR/AcrR family transcriptional regulator [Bacillus sp. FJAT-45350]